MNTNPQSLGCLGQVRGDTEPEGRLQQAQQQGVLLRIRTRHGDPNVEMPVSECLGKGIIVQEYG